MGTARLTAGEFGISAQWFSETRIGQLGGRMWNMVFIGTSITDDRWPTLPYTVINQTPLIREKPYLYVDERGRYFVMVPRSRSTAAGNHLVRGPTPERPSR